MNVALNLEKCMRYRMMYDPKPRWLDAKFAPVLVAY